MEGTIARAAERRPAQRPSGQPGTMREYVQSVSGDIARVLPSVITPEQFIGSVMHVLNSNGKLRECTPSSFLSAMMTAAQLGLKPNTPLGYAYLIPYRNRGVMECQFQLGYRGMIELIHRNPGMTIDAQIVYENDEFECSFGLNPTLKLIPAAGDRGAPVKVYGMWKSAEGNFGFEVMTIEQVRAHAKKYSKAYNNGPWQTNFEEMAKKTVLKRVLKYAPLKVDVANALSTDETIKTGLSENMFDLPDNTVYDVESTDVDFVDVGGAGKATTGDGNGQTSFASV